MAIFKVKKRNGSIATFESDKIKKAIKRLNNYHLKRKNKLNYFQWHLVKDIISDNQTICIEKLNIKGMMANKKIAWWFQSQTISWFLSKLKQKSTNLWVEIIEADRFYPSSKKCSYCGNLKQDLTLKDRVYKCDKCLLEIDRDFNASLNLRALSGEFSDYNHGKNVRLFLADFSASNSNFLRSDYLI